MPRIPGGAADEIKILIAAMFTGKQVIEDAKRSLEALDRFQYESNRNRRNLERAATEEQFRVSQANLKQQILFQKELDVANAASARATAAATQEKLAKEADYFNRLDRAQYQSLQARNSMEQSAAQERVRVSQANLKQQIQIQKALEDQQKRFNDIQRTFMGRLSTMGAKGGMEGAIKQSEEFRASLAALAQDAVVATGIITAFAVAVKTAYDFGKEGAQIDRLRETGSKLAKSFGVDMDEAVTKIKTASHGAITANTAVMQANRSMLLGVTRDSDTMAKLVEIASIRGRAAGLSAEDAFDRITLGIGRLSTRILDDIGIVIDGETAYANYGKAIGKVADDLTEAEKRIALTNAIIEDGNKLLRDTGGLVDDAANAYERFETHIIDTTNALKQHISEGISPLIKTLDILLFGYQDIQLAIKAHALEMEGNAKTYAEYRAELLRVAGSQNLVVESNGDLIEIIQSEYGEIRKLVQENYLLSESELSIKKSTGERDDAGLRLIDTLRAQREAQDALYKTQQEAIDQLHKLRSTAEDFSMDEALQATLDFAKNNKLSADSIAALEEQYAIAFDKISMSVIGFFASIELAADDGIITLEEFTKAFEPVKLEQAAIKVMEAWDKADEKIKELRDEYRKDVLDSERRLADDMAEAATRRDRNLADLEEKNNQDRDEAIADANEKRQRDEEDAESAHQRRIQKILDKYNRSRIQALIDLDARALFEAELTRDQELQDAEEDRKQKREDDEKTLADKIKDIEDNYDERRREILKQYDRDLEDAKESDRQRLRDLRRALDEQVAVQEEAKRKEEMSLEQSLSDRASKEKLDYQQRISDLIGYWQARLHVNAVYEDIERGGTGNVPYGEEPGPPAPVNIPPGNEPTPTEGPYSRYTPASMMMAGGGIRSRGAGQNVVVTLNVQGDGVFASLLRSSILDTIVDVVSD